MSNLVPEKRMDRNGKLVTKHVRNGGPAPATRSAIPAPSVFSRPVITKERRPVYTAIMKASGKFKMSTSDWDSVRKNLLPLSDEELAEVHEAVQQFSETTPSVNWDYMKLAIRNGTALEAARTAKAILDSSGDSIPDTNKTLGRVLVGAVAYKILDEDFSFREDQEDYAKAMVLVTQGVLDYASNYADVISNNVIGMLHMNDYEMTKFVQENKDRPEEIVDALRARGNADPGILRELIDHDVKSLTGGVL